MESGPKSVTTYIQTTKMYKEGAILTKEDSESEPIEVRCPHEDLPMATVTATGSLTLNIGNYESVKFGVTVSLPSVIEEIDDAYETAKEFVDNKLNEVKEDVEALRK